MVDELLWLSHNMWWFTHWTLCWREWDSEAELINGRGLPWWLRGNESACQCRRRESDPWSRKTHMPRVWQLLSLRSRAPEPQLLQPERSRACAVQQEKPPEWEVRAPQLESSPYSPQLQESLCSNEDPAHTHTQTECAPQVCLTLALWSLNHLRMNTNSIYHSFQFTTCARHKTSLFHLICIITPWGRSYTSHSTHDKTEKAKGVVWIITGSR